MLIAPGSALVGLGGSSGQVLHERICVNFVTSFVASTMPVHVRPGAPLIQLPSLHLFVQPLWQDLYASSLLAGYITSHRAVTGGKTYTSTTEIASSGSTFLGRHAGALTGSATPGAR